MRMSPATALVLACLGVSLPACSKPADPVPPAPAADNDWPDFPFQLMEPTANYPIKKCCVCDTDFTPGKKPLVFAYKAYEVQVCDKKCMATFGKDPEGFIKAKVNPRAMFDK